MAPRTAPPRSVAHPAGTRRGAVGPIGLERFRTRTADGAPTVDGAHPRRLADAVAVFDRLAGDARDRSLTDRPEVRAAFGAAVDAIARAIHRLPAASSSSGSGGEIGWVLVERAAARFAHHVLGTEIGRRSCPADVGEALARLERVVDAWS